ncbi:unnamed protein product, partial [Ectocarpus sp. 12 AP-2014]
RVWNGGRGGLEKCIQVQVVEVWTLGRSDDICHILEGWGVFVEVDGNCGEKQRSVARSPCCGPINARNRIECSRCRLCGTKVPSGGRGTVAVCCGSPTTMSTPVKESVPPAHTCVKLVGWSMLYCLFWSYGVVVLSRARSSGAGPPPSPLSLSQV